MIDAAKLDSRQRMSHRQELAEMWDRLHADRDIILGNAIDQQVMEIAITALDAIERVENLALFFEEESGAINNAIASDIRHALSGAL